MVDLGINGDEASGSSITESTWLADNVHCSLIIVKQQVLRCYYAIWIRVIPISEEI
jgi:hypothetical protein